MSIWVTGTALFPDSFETAALLDTSVYHYKDRPRVCSFVWLQHSYFDKVKTAYAINSQLFEDKTSVSDSLPAAIICYANCLSTEMTLSVMDVQLQISGTELQIEGRVATACDELSSVPRLKSGSDVSTWTACCHCMENSVRFDEHEKRIVHESFLKHHRNGPHAKHQHVSHDCDGHDPEHITHFWVHIVTSVSICKNWCSRRDMFAPLRKCRSNNAVCWHSYAKSMQ